MSLRAIIGRSFLGGGSGPRCAVRVPFLWFRSVVLRKNIDLYDFVLLRVTRLEVQAACHVGVLCLASSVPKVQQENSSNARMQ